MENKNQNLFEKHKAIIEKMASLINKDEDLTITPENIFQPAVAKNRIFLDQILEEYILPDSSIQGLEHLKQLYSLSREGKSTLILSGHYSNFDVPALYYLFQKFYPESLPIFESIIFVAGRKLNEQAHVVKVFSEMFNRVIIAAKEPNLSKEEMQLAFQINRASQRKIQELRHQGYIFLIYPTGTRIRPWNKETYRGIREAYNYIRNFEFISFCGIHGNILPTTATSFLLHDIPKHDTMTFTFSPLVKTQEFIDTVLSNASQKDQEDKKQAVVDAVMDQLYSLGDNPYIMYEHLT